MTEKEIDAMVYNKHLDIIKGVVAPAIMTENYLQAYKEGIKDAIQQMMKGSIDGEIRFGTVKVQKEDIKEAVKSLCEGDKVKLIVIKK